MKKAIAVLALVLIVLAGVFAEATLSVGIGAYGEFKESSSFLVGPAVRYYNTSGVTFNKLTVESPMWVKNLDNIIDISGYDIDDSQFKIFKLFVADETFGLAFDLLGDEGLLGLTIGVGGNISASAFFGDSDHRAFYITAGAGADVNFEIRVAKPLTIVVGASANYPLYGVSVIKDDSGTHTSSEALIDRGAIMANAYVGVGLSL